MPDTYTEGEHRLHAAVRAAISPGIWLALGIQMLVLLLSRSPAPAESNPGINLTGVFEVVAILLFLYIQAGAFAALALGRDRISVADVFQRGKEVFTDFMWLAIKASLLLALALSIVIYMFMPEQAQEQDIKAWMEQFSPYFVPLVSVFGFIFVYWIPIVFVRRHFKLFPTWRAALQIAWRRLPYAGYLAFLTLTPSLLSEFLPAIPAVVLMVLSVLGGWMGWVAYIYCVEVLLDEPKPTAPVTAE